MNAHRRLILSASVSTALLLGAGASQAFSFSIGSGEKVQGNGDITSEVRGLNGFDGVSVSGSYKLIVRQGAADRIEVRADKNLLPYIETRIESGSKGRVLEVTTRRGYRLQADKVPEIVIDAAALKSLAVAGSGTIKADGLKSAELAVSVAGSGDVALRDVKAEQMSLKVAGNGDIHAHGQADKLSVSVAGSGDVKARELAAEDARVSIAGNGDVLVNATKRLNVSIAGSGDVTYVGSPEIKSSVAGSGRISRAQ